MNKINKQMPMDNLQKAKNEILLKLFSFHTKGIKPGLERIIKLCDFLGNPERKFKSIHIAGTNGKGSTASMIASILIEAGYKTGLYTSPHILNFNERIQINRQMISDENLVSLSEKILNYGEQISATFFEITTAIAFEYFANQDVDFAVIETGMGGLYDSTNVITPVASIITKIDLDHQEFLGNSIEQIAKEKAGIIKPNIPVIISKNTDLVVEIIRNTAIKNNSKFINTNEQIIELIRIDEDLNSYANFKTENKTYNNFKIALAGNHQLSNVLNVLNLIELLNLESQANVSEIHIRNGLLNVKKNTNLNGRIEIISKNPLVIIDVSHNTNGIEALVDTILQSPYKDLKFNVVFTSLADKDAGKMINLLNNLNININLTTLVNDRANSLEHLESTAKNQCIQFISSNNSNEIFKQVVDSQNPLIVAGSFYLINEFLNFYNPITRQI